MLIIYLIDKQDFLWLRDRRYYTVKQLLKVLQELSKQRLHDQR